MKKWLAVLTAAMILSVGMPVYAANSPTKVSVEELSGDEKVGAIVEVTGKDDSGNNVSDKIHLESVAENINADTVAAEKAQEALNNAIVSVQVGSDEHLTGTVIGQVDVNVDDGPDLPVTVKITLNQDISDLADQIFILHYVDGEWTVLKKGEFEVLPDENAVTVTLYSFSPIAIVVAEAEADDIEDTEIEEEDTEKDTEIGTGEDSDPDDEKDFGDVIHLPGGDKGNGGGDNAPQLSVKPRPTVKLAAAPQTSDTPYLPLFAGLLGFSVIALFVTGMVSLCMKRSEKE